jgi:hypothetical protein
MIWFMKLKKINSKFFKTKKSFLKKIKIKKTFSFKKVLVAGFILIILILPFIYFSFNLFKTEKAFKNFFLSIWHNKTDAFNQNLTRFKNQNHWLKSQFKLFKPVYKLLPKRFQPWYQLLEKNISLITEFNQFWPDILGQTKPKTYFILLQNPYELRPSGGFIGSFATLKFSNGGLADLRVEDIYVPDGQLDGHVDPPLPILEAFKHGFWKLRDSNWDIDFPTASRQISWFFKKGGQPEADGIIALNFFVLKDILKITGPIEVLDYNVKITEENFYQYAQNQAEQDFFPGSTQKKDFLSALTKSLFFQLENLNTGQLLQLVKVIQSHLEEKQILIYFKNPKIQKIMSRQNWAGQLQRQHHNTNDLLADYIYIVDTNLGANKANCCVQRSVEQTIEIKEDSVLETVSINYNNQSQQTGSRPPFFWGGIYKNYLRVILPQEADSIKVWENNQVLNNKIEITDLNDFQLKQIGFFVTVLPQEKKTITLNYIKPVNKKGEIKNYLMEIQKQPGIKFYDHNIKINYKNNNYSSNENIVKDKEIKFIF